MPKGFAIGEIVLTGSSASFARSLPALILSPESSPESKGEEIQGLLLEKGSSPLRLKIIEGSLQKYPKRQEYFHSRVSLLPM